MTFIGELERFFGEVIFPLRIPIAVLAVLALAVLIVIARRRRWDLVVRRRPRLSLAVTVIALAVLVPAGWYFASPLFIRTQLDEPPVAVVPAAPAPAASTADATVAAGAPSSATVLVGEVMGADEFHFGRGRALLIDNGDGTFTLRFEDFSVLNGPDLRVYLSPADGYTDEAIEVGPLRATDGSFNYNLGTIDLDELQSVLIWCEPFGVLFASAQLAAP